MPFSTVCISASLPVHDVGRALQAAWNGGVTGMNTWSPVRPSLATHVTHVAECWIRQGCSHVLPWRSVLLGSAAKPVRSVRSPACISGPYHT